MIPSWEWWVGTDAGLFARVAIGVAFFACLATIDVLRRGRQATRWREYAFLALAAAAAMGYGALNDRIASDISWEYFYYGKGLDQRLGPQTPPDPRALHREAVRVGLKATWTAGLVAGAVLLIANNPRPSRPRLPYRTLVGLLFAVVISASAFAFLGALLGRIGWLTWTNPGLGALVRDDLFRPRRFLTVYRQNLGGYVGGLIGTAWAAMRLVRLRRLAEGESGRCSSR